MSTSSSLSNIVREAFICAVRSCLNIVNFEREQYFISWPLELRNDSKLYRYYDICLKIECFFTEFSYVELYFDPNDYPNLRHQVREYARKRKQLELERRQYEQKLETWYIVYPFKSKLLQQFKHEFQRFRSRCCNYDNESNLNQFNITFIRRSIYPSNTK